MVSGITKNDKLNFYRGSIQTKTRATYIVIQFILQFVQSNVRAIRTCKSLQR